MFELSLNHIKKYMDATLVLQSISFQVYSGEKVGIVGANGSGKTTILKLIAGIYTLNCYPGSRSLGYDEGTISIPKDATVSYLDQIPEYPESYTVEDVLNIAFEEVRELEQTMRMMEEELKTLQGVELERMLKKYSDCVNLYEVKGGYSVQEQYSRIVNGLGFDMAFLVRPFHLLSGGEKTKVVLGKILLDNPDILLLDEPTNHLDMKAVEWLESYLKAYVGMVIIVSHDRYFLDNVVDKIVEIEDQTCQTFKGNYSAYVCQKEEQLRQQEEQYKQQQKKIQSMEKQIKELRDWAIRADNNKFFKRAASIKNRLERMDKINRPITERPNMKLDLSGHKRSGNEVVNCVQLRKSYEDKVLFEDAQMLLQYQERLALIGENGSGKTTFLKMLLQEEAVDSGTLKLGASVQLAYLPQKITFEDEEMTVIECFRDGLDIPEGKAREYLSKLLFYGSTPYKKVRHLSGGEKIRLKLAILLNAPINFLVLDEPTNHLDIDSIETFEEALEDFKGTILFISHDRYFINKIATRVVAIEEKQLVSYDGDYDAYKRIKEIESERVLSQNSMKDDKVSRDKKSLKNQKTLKASDVKEIEPKKPSKFQVERAEQRVMEIEAELESIEHLMSENVADYENINELYNRRHQLNEEMELQLKIWMGE